VPEKTANKMLMKLTPGPQNLKEKLNDVVVAIQIFKSKFE